MDNFKGKAKRLDDIDLPKLGALIGVGEDELHAFMDVESAGSGFDSQGRPKLLFEPHLFYRNLSGKQRDQAVKEGLAYPNWKRGKYPKDSYPRLIRAAKINPAAAIKSASWGLMQVLGSHHSMLGYATPQAMVKAFMDDEEAHLKGAVDYIIATGIDDDLRAHRWAEVARVYNGPKYAEHGYHTKMAKAYAKWAKIKDTPYKPGDLPASPTEDTEVITIPGPAKDETTVVVIDNPKHPPQAPTAKPPTTRTGIMALLAVLGSIVAGVVNYFFGG